MTTIPRKSPAPPSPRPHATPAEDPDYCPSCGTAPCQHPPAGVDVLAVVLIATLTALAGVLLGAIATGGLA